MQLSVLCAELLDAMPKELSDACAMATAPLSSHLVHCETAHTDHAE